jgi:hypothetical protein
MGAPSSSGKTRPGADYEDQGKPFSANTKHTTESSGTIRSTPIDKSIGSSRRGHDFGPSWKDSQNDRGK